MQLSPQTYIYIYISLSLSLALSLSLSVFPRKEAGHGNFGLCLAARHAVLEVSLLYLPPRARCLKTCMARRPSEWPLAKQVAPTSSQ